jgi:hypothetical protein
VTSALQVVATFNEQTENKPPKQDRSEVDQQVTKFA